MARRKIFRDDQKLERRDMAEDQRQRWSSTKSREGRLSYRKASAAVDDKYQRFEEHQQQKPRAQRWFSGLSVSYQNNRIDLLSWREMRETIRDLAHTALNG